MTPLRQLNAILKANKLAEVQAQYPDALPSQLSALAYVKAAKQNSANEIEKTIVRFFELIGGMAERTKNTGRMIDNTHRYTDSIGRTVQIGTKKWIPGTGTKGTTDIKAIYQGKSINIEVKYGKDRMSKDQNDYRDKVLFSGGFHYIAKDFDLFYEALTKDFPEILKNFDL